MQASNSAEIRRQNYITRSIVAISGLILFIAIILNSLYVLAAGSATLSLSSGSSYTVGDTFSVTIRENSGSDPVNAVQADLSYDSSKLQYLSTNVSSSIFNLAGPSSGGSGSVSIARTKDGVAVTGTQTVAVVNFKAIATGSATISFKPSSSIVRNTDYTNVWNGNTTGATYTINPVPVAPAPSTPPSSGGSNSGNTPATNTPSTGGGSSTNNSPSNPSSSDSPDSNAPSSDNSNSTDTSDSGDESSKSEESAVNGAGYVVGIKVLDANKKPVVGAKVTINGVTKTTDNTGVAGFTDMPEGNYKAEIEYDGKKVTSDVSVVKGASTTALQEFTVSLDGKKDSGPNLLVSGSIGLILVAVAAGVVLLVKRFKAHRLDSFYQSTNSDVDTKPIVFHHNPDQPPGTVVTPQPTQNQDSNNEEHQ